MTNWTPGPWKVERYDQPITVCGQSIPCHEVDSDNDAYWIAKVQDHQDCTNTPSGYVNAYLIAAAPELYTALALYVEHFGDPLGGARAALAKARGEMA